MTEEEKQVKPRKPHTPNLDAVIGAVKRGEYDERISELLEAVSEINKKRQDNVLQMVKEVFGPNAQVHWGEDETTSIEQSGETPKRNPFLDRASKTARARAADEPSENVPLPGPYKTDPNDGNQYRADSPVSPTGTLWITDIFGGHRHQLSEDTWRSWQEFITDDGIETVEGVEVMPELDDMEKAMDPVDIERRGAMISGLHSSDIGN